MAAHAALGDVRQHGSPARLHRRIIAKRQDRAPLDPLPAPGSSTAGGPAGSSTSTTLSLGRPSASVDPGDDDDDEDITSTTSEPTTSRTPISTSEPISTPTSTEEPETLTSETTSSTSESSSSVAVITTTIESTSTSTSFSTPEETSFAEPETTTSTPTFSATSSATRALVTSIVTASASLSSTASNSLASSAPSSDSSSSPSAGTVVGIVAGALVGVVVLSGIVGYFFRTKCSNKNDQDDFDGENPFGNMDDGFGGAPTRSELRRDSQLLADDSDSIHQMSELGHGAPSYGNAAPIAMGAGAAAGAYALNRGNSTNNNNYDNLPGLQRNDTMNPRPPTMIQRHYAAQAQQGMAPPQPPAMPSFQPGQIVYPAGQHNQSGPYPAFGGGVPIGGVFPSSSSNNGLHYPSNATGDYGVGGYQQDNNGYDQQFQQQQQQDLPQRSGTPEHANPQQYFHQASDSFGSGIGGPSPFDDGNASPARNQMPYQHQGPHQATFSNNGYNNNGYNDTQGYEHQNSYEQVKPIREGAMKGSERAKRTLSVRNGGAGDPDDMPRDSVYGGM